MASSTGTPPKLFMRLVNYLHYHAGIPPAHHHQQDWGAVVGDFLADIGKFMAEYRQASR